MEAAKPTTPHNRIAAFADEEDKPSYRDYIPKHVYEPEPLTPIVDFAAYWAACHPPRPMLDERLLGGGRVARLLAATHLESQGITIDESVRSGVPVIKGSRLSVSDVLMRLADDYRLSEVCEDNHLSPEFVRSAVECLASALDKKLTD